MTDNPKPAPVSEFPLRMGTAKKTINDLAKNHKHRIRIGRHTKDRMAERGVSIRDIFNVLSSSRSTMQEEPARQANGDYICSLLGVSAGERITVVIALREIDVAPGAKTVTVYVE
ncbi:DUF4258 domain-containing protein [Vibrio mangrovi]|uniref:DUF4258 domain-containing protein n=1 Tax=Vibrio mangrovi TaxID=474394 RepID=A0ABU4I4H1_9VIBR|nr:DUF4258 domain-containing protein [Vibrio mangrovi]MDW6002839.1 DUF4258 domain-containing protein [Vibrio mangrovi]